jgi:hypothetical protein
MLIVELVFGDIGGGVGCCVGVRIGVGIGDVYFVFCCDGNGGCVYGCGG